MGPAITTTSIACAYLLGGIMPGYWLVRWRTGADVRAQGSGGTGATNAGRVLGPAGYAVVMLLDIAKGAAAVAAARAVGVSEPWVAAVAFAVVIGHVWPVLLGFRGGRGMASMAGAWITIAPWSLALCFLPAGLVFAVNRRAVISGLCGLCFLPATAWWATGGTLAAALAAAGCALVVLFAHRDHLRRWLRPESVPS